MNYREEKSTILRVERDRALFEAYTRAIGEFDFNSQEDAINYVRTHEAPRFYIEGEFCGSIISRRLRNLPAYLNGEHHLRRTEELLRRYKEMRKLPKYKELSTGALCDIIVEQKAPEFYISYRTARGIISRERERKCKEIQIRAKL